MSNTTFDLSWADVYPARPGRGGDIKVPCPFCRPRSKNPNAKCLSINQSTGAFMCHDDECEAKGIIKEERHKPIGYTPPAPAKVYQKPVLTGSQPASEKVLAFMEARGVSRETCAEMRIHSKYDADGKEWIGFPYIRQGTTDVHHVKYRAVDGKEFRSTKDTERTFFGLQTLEARPDTIYVTEGEIDALTMIEAGFRNVLSLPDGSNGPNKNGPVKQGHKLDCLPSAEKELVGARRVVLVVDNDDAGRAMAAELVNRIGVAKTAVVQFPSTLKDANDYAMAYGTGELRRLVMSARLPQIEGVSVINDYATEIWEHRDVDEVAGLAPPNMPYLGKLFRIMMGLLVTVVGPPGAGKSSFLRAVLLAISGATPDFPIAFFAPEDAAVPKRFFEKFVRLVYGGQVAQMTEDEYQAVVEQIEERVILIHPETNHLDDILLRAEYAILNYGIKVLVIDPWTEVVTTRERGEDQVDHINRCLTRLQQFARSKGVTIIVSAHPTKEAAMSAAKEGRLLDLYSVSGTAGWNNKTDIGISIRRSTEHPDSIVTEVHTVKVRDALYGTMGAVEFRHDPATGWYTELGPKG